MGTFNYPPHPDAPPLNASQCLSMLLNASQCSCGLSIPQSMEQFTPTIPQLTKNPSSWGEGQDSIPPSLPSLMGGGSTLSLLPFLVSWGEGQDQSLLPLLMGEAHEQ